MRMECVVLVWFLNTWLKWDQDSPMVQFQALLLGKISSSNLVPVRSYEGFGTTRVRVCLSGKEVYRRKGTITPKGLYTKV